MFKPKTRINAKVARVIIELQYYSRLYRIKENPSEGHGNALVVFLQHLKEGTVHVVDDD